jgi:hypothetical protein
MKPHLLVGPSITRGILFPLPDGISNYGGSEPPDHEHRAATDLTNMAGD